MKAENSRTAWTIAPEQVLVIPPKVLTHKQREFYLQNGYLLLENVIPKETIQYLRRVTDEMVEQTRALRASNAVWDLEPREGIPIMQLNRGIERLHDLARGPGRLNALGRGDHESGEIGQGIRIGIARERTASCDFIFEAVRSSAVQDRSMSVDGARCGSVARSQWPLSSRGGRLSALP